MATKPSETAARASRHVRGAASATAGAARRTGRYVRKATAASGAGRTGLAQLIELSALNSAGDAMLAVALAGSIFFGLPVDEARGRVALYLLITVAPFAIVAPIVGPALDRWRSARRYAIGATMLARGLLCWGMASAVSHNDSVTLLPAAFAVLVLSKAFGISRSAVTPRVLPGEITLVTANARCTLAGLVGATIGGGAAAGVYALAGPDWALRVATLVFCVGIILAIRLPGHIDDPDPIAVPEPEPASNPGPEPAPAPAPNRAVPAHGGGTRPYTHPLGMPPDAGGTSADPHSGTSAGPYGHRRAEAPGGGAYGGPRVDAGGAGPSGGANGGRQADGRDGGGSGKTAEGRGAGNGRAGRRLGRWRTLVTVGPVVGEAVQANAAIRVFSGFMVLFCAFLLRETAFDGVSEQLALGILAVAAGVGGLAGTVVGSAVKARAPHLIVFGTLAAAAAAAALGAVFFGLALVGVAAFVAASAQALGKLGMDAIVQREIGEEVRSSTFAVSETLHQLAWVVGGLAGLALSLTDNGTLAFALVGAVLLIWLVALLVRRSARRRAWQAEGRIAGRHP